MINRIIVILLSLILISCDNILPLPLRGGNNTFGCKVEGFTLKANKTNLLGDKPIFASMTDSTFYISARDYNDKLYVIISLENIRQKGVNRNYPETYYQIYNQYGGQVHITKFDVKNKIVSGTFSFNAVKVDQSVYPNKLDTTKVVEITKGRFDVDLNKLKK